MNIKDFNAGNFIQQYQYKSFSPSKINEEWIVSDPLLQKLLEEANIRLGELNAFSIIVPDVDLFIRMHIIKEATTSSRIEGTQTHIEEAVLKEKDVDPGKREDWLEVQNYIAAMNSAIEQLVNLPVSSRLIKLSHKILLENVRGKDKLPGEYRQSQNWIGGATLKDAVFIPPHHSEIPELLGDLENFINNDSLNVPHIIKIAIAHYQFETIHPFLDGNGRIGRLLITLFLVDQKILQKPLLYLSAYFEKNKGLYYDNLTFVRTKNDMTQWLKYFLVGIAETAENATQTLSAILELKARLENSLINTYGKRAGNANLLLQHLFKKPVIQVKQAQSLLGVSYKSANDLIGDFVRVGTLKEMTGQSRNRMFVFDEYLKMFRL